MLALFVVFIGISALLWFSVYGYFFILWIVAKTKHDPDQELRQYPEIAVVIPTLNEEKYILPKLENLKSSDFPPDRMTILVVDGGSSDRTVELVETVIERGERVQLIHVDNSRGKFDQIQHALDQSSQKIIVVNDADSVLEQSSIKELIRFLALNPEVAAVGAAIKPDSTLLEEQIHWKLMNTIWWMEGRVLSAASISGVCNAFRREKAFFKHQEIRAEDIHQALAASSRGHPVRICRKALALETRVPQTIKEFIEFRRRRGGGYVSELLLVKPEKNTPTGYRIARLMRLWHFLVVPKIGIGIGILGLILLLSPYKIWLIPIFIGLSAPALILLYASDIASGKKYRWLRLSWAACRLLVLSLYSLLSLYFHPKKQGAVGGQT